MILPDTIIKSKASQILEYEGTDSFGIFYEKTIQFTLGLFKSKPYKYEISYNYNSRGFRDDEWPTENLQDCIWCIGDSFTVGIGVEYDHIWPQILQKKLQKRTINISLDGASNNWIARHACSIIKEIKPKYLVIHWSYLNRREMSLTEVAYPYNTYVETDFDVECARRIHMLDNQDNLDDIKNLQDCIEKVSCQQDTNVIHSFIPEFYYDYTIYNKLNFYDQKFCKPFYCLDYGRDIHHYGYKTATRFVDNLCNLF